MKGDRDEGRERLVEGGRVGGGKKRERERETGVEGKRERARGIERG